MKTRFEVGDTTMLLKQYFKPSSQHSFEIVSASVFLGHLGLKTAWLGCAIK